MKNVTTDDLISAYIQANIRCNTTEEIIARNGYVLRDFFRYIENIDWEITIKDKRL